MRKAVGDDKMTYLGFSYGTFLGATYASLFPRKMPRRRARRRRSTPTCTSTARCRACVSRRAGFERAIGRFFQACAADQAACSGFGGKDPWLAFD